jgi:hypothetical protein
MSTTVLLAGTLLAAGQAIQPGGGQERGQGGAQSQSQPNRDQSDRSGQREPSRNAQSNQGTRGQAQERTQERTQEKTQGQAQQPKGRAEGQERQGQTQQREQTQGQSKQREQTQGQAPRGQERQQTQERAPQTEQRGGNVQQGERGGGNASVTLTTEQRTRIRDTVLKEKDAPRVGRVDFSVREGTVIPRTVHVVEVPRVIIDIHPEWRGYKYFIVNDEIVIVEPSTLRIVAVIPA